MFIDFIYDNITFYQTFYHFETAYQLYINGYNGTNPLYSKHWFFHIPVVEHSKLRPHHISKL